MQLFFSLSASADSALCKQQNFTYNEQEEHFVVLVSFCCGVEVPEFEFSEILRKCDGYESRKQGGENDMLKKRICGNGGQTNLTSFNNLTTKIS